MEEDEELPEMLKLRSEDGRIHGSGWDVHLQQLLFAYQTKPQSQPGSHHFTYSIVEMPDCPQRQH